jgi:hypothetical protein
MICRLCGLDKKLIEAHVIPRSFFRIDPAEKRPSRLATNVHGRYAQKLPKGVYDSNILCEECEHRFSGWDDYADELFLRSWDSFAPIIVRGTVAGYRRRDYDYPKLKLFFLSVLWRASVSAHPFFSAVDLGIREPILRDSVWRADPGDLDHFGVVLQAFDYPDIGILNPHAERFSGRRYFRFYLSHVIAFIKVDSRPFEDPFRSMALGAGRELVLAEKDFTSSPERRIMKQLAIAENRGPNQAVEPTRTAVTPLAGAGDRASGARGSP